MRLLSVTKSTGGLARYNDRLCRRLADRGTEVRVVCLSEGSAGHAEALRKSGIPAVAMDMARYRVHPASDLRLAARLIRLVRAGDYDVVVGHGSKAGFLARLAGRVTGVPAVYRLASMAFLSRVHGHRAYVYRELERVGRVLGGHVVTVAESTRRELIRQRLAPPGRVTTIPTGIDLVAMGGPLPPAAARRALGLDTCRPVVGWAARLVPQKAPLDYVRAAAEIVRAVPGTQVVLAGDGPLSEAVKALVRTLRLEGSIHLRPWQSDVRAFLSALDVYVLTSRWEGLPQSLLEAMALGRPSVATAVDGTPEVIRDGVDGFLVSAGDVGDLATRVTALLRDDVLRRRMGHSGRERVRSRFEVLGMIEAWERLLARLGGQGRGGG